MPELTTFLEWMDYSFWGNSLRGYLGALLFLAAALLVLRILKNHLIRRFKVFTQKTQTNIDDLLIGLFEKTVYSLLYLGAFYLAVQQLTLNHSLAKLIQVIAISILTIQVTRLVLAVVVFAIQEIWINKGASGAPIGAASSLVQIAKAAIWGVALLFLLDNLGFDVTAVVAGLGIGGVAVALAAQTILGDIFNYFVIFFDKPFEEGDFIIVGDFLGVIEHIGLKTTRVRSLGGEQVVFSNSDLTNSRIRNYKRMEKRRVLFKLGVTYPTSAEMLKKTPEIIKEVIAGVKETVFDRAHFQSFGDFSLNLEAVYYVLSADYNKYMDIQQEINFKIKERFEAEGIEFAFPTQTIYMAKE